MDNYLFGKYITDDGLKHIKEHKYKSGGYSFLDNIINPWWEFVVTLVPMSVAPNTLTLIGVIINFGFYIIMFYHDPTMSKELPGYAYAGFAFGIFCYQTLDAIDGKQARRTGSSSPLGQLFDHGCDTLSTTLLGVALLHTLQIGITCRAKIIMGVLWCPFYIAQLLEHHVGIVRTHVGNVGVTEGQLGQAGILLSCTIFGGNLYVTPLSDVLSFTGLGAMIPQEYQLRDVVIFVLASNAIVLSLYFIYEMLINLKTLTEQIKCIYRLLPCFGFIAFLYFIDPTDEFSVRNASLLINGGGLIFTLITTKLIISNMAVMPFSGFHFELLIFGIFFYVQYCTSGSDHSKNMFYAFVVSLALATLLYLRFVRT